MLIIFIKMNKCVCQLSLCHFKSKKLGNNIFVKFLCFVGFSCCYFRIFEAFDFLSRFWLKLKIFLKFNYVTCTNNFKPEILEIGMVLLNL